MSIETTLYLIEVLENIGRGIPVVFALCVMLLLGLGGFLLFECDKESRPKAAIKALEYCFSLTIALVIVFCFIPSGKTMRVMLAANVIRGPAVPDKILLKIIEMKLDEYIDNEKSRVRK